MKRKTIVSFFLIFLLIIGSLIGNQNYQNKSLTVDDLSGSLSEEYIIVNEEQIPRSNIKTNLFVKIAKIITNILSKIVSIVYDILYKILQAIFGINALKLPKYMI